MSTGVWFAPQACLWNVAFHIPHMRGWRVGGFAGNPQGLSVAFQGRAKSPLQRVQNFCSAGFRRRALLGAVKHFPEPIQAASSLVCMLAFSRAATSFVGVATALDPHYLNHWAGSTVENPS